MDKRAKLNLRLTKSCYWSAGCAGSMQTYVRRFLVGTQIIQTRKVVLCTALPYLCHGKVPKVVKGY